MENVIKEYEHYLQSILDDHTDLPDGSTAGGMIAKLRVLQTFIEDYNNRANFRANEILSTNDDSDGVLKTNLENCIKEYFQKYKNEIYLNN